MDPREYVQGGILAMLGSIITGLFTWRAVSKVKHDNAKEALDSRHEEAMQRRYDAAMARNSQLEGELRTAKDGRALLERKVREQAKRLNILLEMLGDSERKQAARWIEESGFAPFESGSGRRKG
jgi:hypothetical protein